MEIVNVISETVKDVVALSQNVAKAVKGEVELYFEQKGEHEGEGENEEGVEHEEDVDNEDEIEGEASKGVFEYLEDFEVKFKDLMNNAFTKFNFSKSEEQEELEARIAALEEKLSQLVEDSLEALRKEDADRI
jgi:BMFP domain-containing protein YqiC